MYYKPKVFFPSSGCLQLKIHFVKTNYIPFFYQCAVQQVTNYFVGIPKSNTEHLCFYHKFTDGIGNNVKQNFFLTLIFLRIAKVTLYPLILKFVLL